MKLELQILVTLFAALSAMAASSGRSASSSRLFGITNSQSSCGSTTHQRSILDIRGGAVHESSTIGDLESKIQSAALQNKLTIIDFTATWCGPCKMIAPVFKELSEEYGSRAQFIKVDVDDNPEAAQKYGVTAMPTFLFIKGGEVVDRLMVRDTSYIMSLAF